jgi:carboxymethylenebutenolidase
MDEMKWAAARAQAGAAAASRNLPPDDMGAVQRLASSPRKSEFVKIDVGGSPMRAFVVYPDRRDKAPVVVVIQEIFGLSDWIRGVADQLAADGFIAVAPDLLAGRGPNGGDSTSLSQQETTQATLGLPAAEITAKLKAAREYGLKLPNANGKSASVGYCFGGNQSFAFAVNEPALNAAVVYYGTAPTDVAAPARGGGGGGRGAGGPGGGAPGGGAAPAAGGGAPAGGRAGGGGGGQGRGGAPAAPFVPSDSIANTKAPVLGLYGGADARVNASIPATEMKMKELGKVYEPHIFEGAAHGFLRAQSGNDGANMKATQEAWPLTIAWIKKYTS